MRGLERRIWGFGRCDCAVIIILSHRASGKTPVPCVRKPPVEFGPEKFSSRAVCAAQESQRARCEAKQIETKGERTRDRRRPQREFPRRAARRAGAAGNSQPRQSGHRSRHRAGRGSRSRLPGRRLRRKGREDRSRPRRRLRPSRHHHPGPLLWLERPHRQSGHPAPAPRPASHRFPAPAGLEGNRPGNRRYRRKLFRRRTDAAHHARAVDGRAFLDGHDLRLQSGDHRRRHAAQALPDADHCRGHDHACARADHRLRRCGTAGHRHGQAPWRGRFRIRSAPRRKRAGAEPRRAIRRAADRSQGRAGRARLRHARRTKLSTPASANCWAGWSPKATW